MVSVELLAVTTNWVLPWAAAEILTVQVNLLPAEEPVQEAGNVLAPCLKLTVVEQLAGEALHGKFTPLIVNAKLDRLSVAWLTSSGDSFWTRGKEEDVVSIKRTFCR